MNTALHSPVFKSLALGEIQPEGWLLNQLRIQAAGLSGNLDRFWPDIKDSQWLGGSRDGWERLPYWLDGFIPLAWLLDDEDMKARACRYINHILENQSPDGWICPGDEGERRGYDLWAMFLILKVLVVYHDATEDERIEEAIRKALLAVDRHLDGTTLFGWGQMRWFESLIAIWWLYDRTEEAWLLRLASKLSSQGFDWVSFFKYHWPYTESDPRGRWGFMSHVVNNAMMLKSGALLWRMTGLEEHLDSAENMVSLLDKHHGMVTGVFTGDECLAGTSPVQGTELCAVQEYMNSLEHLLEITGKPHWGDRLERIAYNALPATFSPDMWTHQYDQQVNQVECSRQSNPVFKTNSGESNIFGLEPNYGCCTANLSQAWPKFAARTFMRSEDGLAVTAYAPCRADTTVTGVPVRIRLETEYPFRDILNFKVETEREIEFALWLRIPSWAKDAELEIDGEIVSLESNGFHRLQRRWDKETSFTLRLPMFAKLVARPNNLYAITRGPLVYSLLIGERWERINQDVPGREEPHCDYEVYPTTPWSYGLCVEKDNLEASISFVERIVGNCPFSPEGAPVIARVHGKRVDWPIQNGAALPVPRLDWISDNVEELTLIPYGCTNLRLTEMPIV
jgi:hypothetical protein